MIYCKQLNMCNTPKSHWGRRSVHTPQLHGSWHCVPGIYNQKHKISQMRNIFLQMHGNVGNKYATFCIKGKMITSFKRLYEYLWSVSVSAYFAVFLDIQSGATNKKVHVPSHHVTMMPNWTLMLFGFKMKKYYLWLLFDFSFLVALFPGFYVFYMCASLRMGGCLLCLKGACRHMDV